MKSIPLLPYRFRYAGFVFLFLGILSGYMYYFAGKPDFFTTRIFAIITSYLETRYWVVAQTNLLDEMTAIFILAGLATLVFSKEKDENEMTNNMRLKAFVYASYTTLIIWILFFLLVYGWPIFIFSSFIFIIFLITNVVVFRILLFRYNRLKQIQKRNKIST